MQKLCTPVLNILWLAIFFILSLAISTKISDMSQQNSTGSSLVSESQGSAGGGFQFSPRTPAEGQSVPMTMDQLSDQPVVRFDPPISSGDPGRDLAVNRAMDDLAFRLGVSLSDLKVNKVDPAVWDDPALGCGLRVTLQQSQGAQGQVSSAFLRIEGLRIFLASGNAVYEYRSGDGRLVLCK